jgi:hypothetical protein
MGIFLIIVGIIVFASLQYRTDVNYLENDYQAWKNNRR